MVDEIRANGRLYMWSKDAAEQFPLSYSYLHNLAREGRIGFVMRQGATRARARMYLSVSDIRRVVQEFAQAKSTTGQVREWLTAHPRVSPEDMPYRELAARMALDGLHINHKRLSYHLNKLGIQHRVIQRAMLACLEANPALRLLPRRELAAQFEKEFKVSFCEHVVGDACSEYDQRHGKPGVNPEIYMTMDEAMRSLVLKRRAVKRCVDRGVLASIKVLGRRYLSRASVTAYAAERAKGRFKSDAIRRWLAEHQGERVRACQVARLFECSYVTAWKVMRERAPASGPLAAVEANSYLLDELLAGITPENRHDEWDTGPAVGNEAW